MKRKIYFKKVYIKINKRNIILGILGIFIFFIVFSLTYAFIARNRLKTTEGKSDFDITTLLNISKDRITTESETYNKKEFIEYDCIIDGIYLISIVKVGKVSNTKILDSLHFAKQIFQERNGRNICTPHPMGNIFSGFGIPWYNVFLLPFKEINQISIFIDETTSKVDEATLQKEWLNNTILSISFKNVRTLFSFNNMDKSDLIFSAALLPNIFLTIDAENNLYIGCQSTKSMKMGTKRLKEILED